MPLRVVKVPPAAPERSAGYDASLGCPGAAPLLPGAPAIRRNSVTEAQLHRAVARARCRVQSQAIVRWKARLTVPTVVLAVSLHASTALSYSPVKLGLRHAVSAYRGGPWEQWARAGAAQGSIIASGTLRGSRRYLDDAHWHLDELGVLAVAPMT